MITRSARRKLIQQSVQCKLLCNPQEPTSKVKIKTNFVNIQNNPPIVIQSPVVECSEVKKKSTGDAGIIEETGECVVKTASENAKMTPDSTTIEPDSTNPIHNNSGNSKHLKTCYCDCIILPPLQSVGLSTTVSNINSSNEISHGIEKNHSDENRQPVQLSVKSGSIAVPPSAIVNRRTSREVVINRESLLPTQLITDILEAATDQNIIEYSDSNEGLRFTDDWKALKHYESYIDKVTSLQPNSPVRSRPKVEILRVLYLPPGTIDPYCPIDIFEEPLDLSMKRPIENSPITEPLDLCIHEKTHTPNKSVCDEKYETPQLDIPNTCFSFPAESSLEMYQLEDDILLLDASYTGFDSICMSSGCTEYSGSPILDKTQEEYIEQQNLCYESQEDYRISSSVELPNETYFSDDMSIRQRVYEVLDYPCLRYFGYVTCTNNSCKYRHDLVEPTDLQTILEAEQSIVVEKCYLLVQQFDSLLIQYFEIFCIVFGKRQMIETLIGMIKICEASKRPVLFYRHIITGLQLCNLDKTTCFEHLIHNSTLKSPKLFNSFIWIMVDLKVVLEFRDTLNGFLKYDGYYLSPPNLTRLLGVCSRTKDCELIRIIYEAVENYPENIKKQLHWSVRPQFIRMEKSSVEI